MAFDIANIAENAATGLIGGALGMVFEKHNDQRQISQQQKLQDIQIAGQKQMADYNYQKQLDMWNATNYKAQMEQLQKAGLNPGLLYGMSGGGGVTTGSQGGNVTGATAQQNPGEIQQGMGIILQNQNMAAQRDLLEAQKQNVDADTANKKSENPNIAKTGNLIDANTDNAKANTALQKANTIIADAQGKIQQGTIEEQIHTLTMAASQLDETVDALHRANFIGDATKYTQIAQAKADLAKTVIDTAMDKMTTSLTEQQRNLVKQQSHKYMDLLAAQMGLMSRQGQSAMSQAASAEEQANVASQRQQLEATLHDMTDSEKEISDLVGKVLQAVGLRGLLNPQSKPNKIGYK